jgi:hypothetical protein
VPVASIRSWNAGFRGKACQPGIIKEWIKTKKGPAHRLSLFHLTPGFPDLTALDRIL